MKVCPVSDLGRPRATSTLELAPKVTGSEEPGKNQTADRLFEEFESSILNFLSDLSN